MDFTVPSLTVVPAILLALYLGYRMAGMSHYDVMRIIKQWIADHQKLFWGILIFLGINDLIYLIRSIW